LSPYNVIIYLFCIEILLYSKDVTFDPVPLFIICVRLGPSTPGDYVRARVLVPRNPGVTPVDPEHLKIFYPRGRDLDSSKEEEDDPVARSRTVRPRAVDRPV
jgi:hypothetical protein